MERGWGTVGIHYVTFSFDKALRFNLGDFDGQLLKLGDRGC